MCGRYSMGMVLPSNIFVSATRILTGNSKRLDRLRLRMREDGIQAEEFVDENELLERYFPACVLLL